MKNIRHSFGREAVVHDGTYTDHIVGINRPELSKRVFQNQGTINILRAISSPGIKKLMFEKFAEIEHTMAGEVDLIAIEGATIIESGTAKFFDEVWVLTLDKESAFKRVKVRNPDLSDSEIKKRLEVQTTDEERLKYAHWSYDTSDNHTLEENMALVEAKLQAMRMEFKLQL